MVLPLGRAWVGMMVIAMMMMMATLLEVLFLLLVQMPCSMFGIQHHVMFKPYSMFDRVCTFKCHQAEAWRSGLQNQHRQPSVCCRHGPCRPTSSSRTLASYTTSISKSTIFLYPPLPHRWAFQVLSFGAPGLSFSFLPILPTSFIFIGPYLSKFLFLSFKVILPGSP